MSDRSRHTGWVLLLACFFLPIALPVGKAAAQDSADRYTMVLREAPLAQALERLAGTTNINLIYDSRLVEGITVFCVKQEAPADELLRCLLEGTGLDFYQTSAGTYVLTEAVREAPRYGRLAGAIVDEETGEPLPFANVFLADAGVGTSANEAGFFSISTLKPGPYRVVISYVGYEPKADSVWVMPGGQTRERFALNTRAYSAEPIVVTGLEQRVPSRALGRGELSEEELVGETSPAGGADVARSTASLLGIILQEPSADLHLQGGAAGELAMQLDGIPIRNPVTLGHLLGAFSPLALERMTVHRAGYGAQHGSHLSGAIAAEHALGRAGHRHLSVQMDPLSLNARGQAVWQREGGGELRAMLAGRSSLWSVFREPTLSQLLEDWHLVDPLLTPSVSGAELAPGSLGHRGEVSFSDLHGAARMRFNPFHTVHASFYRGHNEVDSEAFVHSADAPSTPELPPLLISDYYNWTNTGGQVRYEGLLGARLLGSLALYGSRQEQGHGYQMGSSAERYDESASDTEAPYDGNWVDEVSLEAGLGANLLRRHHLSGAITLIRTSSRALINNHFFRELDYRSQQWRLASFFQNDLSLGARTRLEMGTRLTYIPERATVYAEPRLALRYDGAHPSLGDYALRLAGGVYRQFVNQFDVSSTGPTAVLPFMRFWLPTDHSLAPPRAYHLAAEALWLPEGPWQVNLETYHKWQPHLLDINYAALIEEPVGEAPLNHASFIEPTRGRSYGADLRLRYTTPGVEGSASYSLSRSVRQFPGRFDGLEQPVPWEHPHRLVLEGAVRVAEGAKVHLAWQGVWGRSWAFRRAYYDYFAPLHMNDLPFDLQNPSEQRLRPLYQLDAGLSYRYSWGDMSIDIRAEVLNVLGRENAFDLTLEDNGERLEEHARLLPGRRPVLSLRVSY